MQLGRKGGCGALTKAEETNSASSSGVTPAHPWTTEAVSGRVDVYHHPQQGAATQQHLVATSPSHFSASSCSAQKSVKMGSAGFSLVHVASSLENSPLKAVTLALLPDPFHLLCSYLYSFHARADMKKPLQLHPLLGSFATSEETLQDSESGSKVNLSLGAYYLQIPRSVLLVCHTHTRA